MSIPLRENIPKWQYIALDKISPLKLIVRETMVPSPENKFFLSFYRRRTFRGIIEISVNCGFMELELESNN